MDRSDLKVGRKLIFLDLKWHFHGENAGNGGVVTVKIAEDVSYDDTDDEICDGHCVHRFFIKS